MLRATVFVCSIFAQIFAVAMLFPVCADLVAGHGDWQAFLVSALMIGIPAAILAMALRADMPRFSLRYGLLLVNAVWLTASLCSAVPIWLAVPGLPFADALFEAVSGVTTTGSTVLTGLDTMPPGLLLWRSMIQWLGGLGIIAMGLLLLPFLKVGGMQIYRLESSAQSDSPFQKFKQFSLALVGLYCSLTIACCIGYALAGMTLFDAVNHAMTTLSTGGYSTHDASMGHYGNPVRIVSTLFMIAGALPFVALLRTAASGKFREIFDVQVPVMLSIMGVLSVFVALAAIPTAHLSPVNALVDASFNIVSVITTTGYASTDYTLWGAFPVTLFLLATFLGGAAGSTSGGLKTYRLIILYGDLRNSLRELVYPNGIFVQRYEGVVVSAEAVRSVSVFLSAFLAALLLFTVALGATGIDLVTAFSGALTALTNVGPGLGETIGPAGNFAPLPGAAKWLLVLAMLLGRLEILTVLVLASPTFWRK